MIRDTKLYNNLLLTCNYQPNLKFELTHKSFFKDLFYNCIEEYLLDLNYEFDLYIFYIEISVKYKDETSFLHNICLDIIENDFEDFYLKICDSLPNYKMYNDISSHECFKNTKIDNFNISIFKA